MNSRSNAVRRFVLVLLAAAVVPIVPFVVIGELPGERWLTGVGEEAWGFGFVGAALLASDILLPIPSSILGTLLGARLGFVPGFLWTFLGLTAGNLVGYGMGRLWPRRHGDVLTGAPAAGLIFLSRPVPVLAEAATLAAGVERVPVGLFLGMCSLGNGVYAAAMAANGATLLPEGWTGAGLVLPMMVPVVGWLLWRRFR